MMPGISSVASARGSLVVPEDYAWQLYVCDESGMPALRRRLESIAQLPVRPDVPQSHYILPLKVDLSYMTLIFVALHKAILSSVLD